jgi:hypothetical protein
MGSRHREEIMGFEHQEPSTNLGFCRTLPRPQQIGVRLKPEEKQPEAPAPKRPPEGRSF